MEMTLDNLEKWIIYKQNGHKSIKSNLLLKKGFEHAFFCKTNQDYGPQILSLGIKGLKTIHATNQVHGSKIIKASNASENFRPNADGIISEKKNQSLWVYTADCLPILIANPRTGQTGSCHAGWKGLADGIISRLIEGIDNSNKYREDLIVAIGPSISRLNYVVGYEVVESISKGKGASITDCISRFDGNKDFCKNNEIFNDDNDYSRYFLDLSGVAIVRLQEKGVREMNITTSKICTYTKKELFHSWRRNRIKCSQWSYILSH